jgi:AcrR family transcriptional regulator
MAKELPERTPRKRLTRDEQKALTRARLIESAQALFARHGYEGTSIDQVATDAGYTRGAFYANFSNKEALMQELIVQGFDGDLGGIDAMAKAAQTNPSVEEMAASFAQLARSFYEEPSNTLWMLEFQLAAVRHPELRSAYTEQFSRLRDAVRDIIMKVFEDHDPSKKKDAARFADVFIAILSGVSLIRILDPEEIDESIFADTFRALVEGMYRR